MAHFVVPCLVLLLLGGNTLAQIVPVENSVLYYAALKQANVPAEMHVYHDGGHGFGMSAPNPPTASWGHWKEQLLGWLKSRGL